MDRPWKRDEPRRGGRGERNLDQSQLREKELGGSRKGEAGGNCGVHKRRDRAGWQATSRKATLWGAITTFPEDQVSQYTQESSWFTYTLKGAIELKNLIPENLIFFFY